MVIQGRLPGTARIGGIRLAVSNLARSLSFYTDVLGLAIKTRTADVAALTAHDSDNVLVELQKIAGVRPVTRQTRLGLYHFAMLLPSRSSLASFVEHLVDRHVRFGSSDHLVSEALYLSDPDGIQIEVYADRARSGWRFIDGEVELGSSPLRFEELLATRHEFWSGAPAGTTLGHLHFYVGDLAEARRFYNHALGFDIVHASSPGVLFLSAGGYHHHVGLNTWAQGASLVEPTDARLLSWELLLDDEEQVSEIQKRLQDAGFPELVDPWHNRLQLRALAPEGEAEGTP